MDCINIGDSPMARVRMGCISLALHIQRRVGLDTIIHFTTRDRNLMALQSELLGAHSHGIRNILALTGDPPRMGNLPQAKAVWDVDSIGLIKILKRMNEGQDWAGNSIGMQAQFFVGCAVNPVADDLELELDRFHRKLEAGADYVMCQPLYDMEQLTAFLDRVGKIPVPFLLGVMPLQSYRHAEFLHNELPGVVDPGPPARADAAGRRPGHPGGHPPVPGVPGRRPGLLRRDVPDAVVRAVRDGGRAGEGAGP